MYQLFLIPLIKLHLKSSSVVTPSLFFFFSSSSSFVSFFFRFWTFRLPPLFPSPAPSSSLQREHQEPGESGEFPSAHQVSFFQFEVGPVTLLHLDQNAVAGSFACHIMVVGECRDHRPAVVHQAHLDEEKHKPGKSTEINLPFKNVLKEHFSIVKTCQHKYLSLIL